MAFSVVEDMWPRKKPKDLMLDFEILGQYFGHIGDPG